MSTWTDQEYKKLLVFKGGKTTSKTPVILEETNETEMDWREKGAVNQIKNQGKCGSCQAFSATCAVEGAYFLKTGQLLSLSEQELVSCDNQAYSYGCNGGFQSDAFNFLVFTGQELESDYPYTSVQGDSGACKYDASKGKVKIDAFDYVKMNDVAQLKAAIAKTPVSVTIEADSTVFRNYKSGILDSPECGTNLNHAVAAVGFGTESGKDYYIVRNSWGTEWGDEGYVKIAAVDGMDICGIQQDSLYSTYNS